MFQWLHDHARQLFAIFGYLIISILLVSSGYGVNSSDRGAAVNVTVRAAGQEGPLQIIGLRPPQFGRSTFIAIHLRNTSDKATEDYSVKPLVQAPNSTGEVWDHTNAHAAIRPGYGVIPPGGEVWNEEIPVLSPTTVASAARDLHSTCLQITPVVLGVQFADGATWKSDISEMGDALARGNRVDNGPACGGAVGANNDLGQLKNIIEISSRHFDSDHSLFRSVDPSGVQSFSFSCYLHRRDDSQIALLCGR
jgi:hypothetical protein